MSRPDRRIVWFGFFFLMVEILLICPGCDTTKKLPKGEELYTGATIHIHSDSPVPEKGIKKELIKVEGPSPNSSFLGIRFQLWMYMMISKDKGKGLGHFLKTKMGEPPVLMSDLHPEKTAELMKNRLFTSGYFHAQITFEKVRQKRKISICYTVILPIPYLVHRVSFPEGVDSLEAHIRATKKESLIKEGVQYNLELFKEERLRIEKELRNAGFYYFNADYLLFQADSIKNAKQVNVRLILKPEIPARARRVYTLNTIYIIPSLVSVNDSFPIKTDTLKMGGYDYLNSDSAFRPKAILQSIYLKKGHLYNRNDHTLTLRHLMEMGIFRSVEIRFVESADSAGILDVYIRLFPLPRKSIQADLEAITKSDNFTGPSLTMSFKDRNIFKGGELYVFNLLGSFETQIGKNAVSFNSYELGVNTQLYFPEFITPFRLKRNSNLFLPKTKIDLGARLLQRVLYYNMTALNASFGYKWKKTPQKEYELDPIYLSFTKLLNTTNAFNTLLLENPYLKTSFEEQFIIGSNYSYTYNSQIGSVKRSQFYFNGTLQLSGNSLYLMQSLFSPLSATEENPYKVFGFPYAQYSRFTLDERYYFTVNKMSRIAVRFYGGVALPYGNSSTIPYVEQFFSGGSNSIRAFQARSLGPGSYKIPDSLAGRSFLDQSGDIKLEGNLEYRFNILKILKGAIFTDAGNVWLARKNAQYPGGEFNITDFQNEIAVGAGAGLRFDLSFFVLRFDLAFPLREPSLPENERWVINRIDFEAPSWRQQNLVLNIAVGYPF